MAISNQPESPRVEIIVPNFNGEDYLTPCLMSLLDQDYSNYGITVVDNDSKDRSADLVRHGFPQVKLIENSRNTGYAGGCNAGLKRALKRDASFMVLVNSDTRADRDWLSQLVRAASSDDKIGVCQSMIYLGSDIDDGRKKINSAGNEVHFLAFGYCGHYLEQDVGQFEAVTDVPFASGSAMLVRRETLEDVGLLDEDFFLYQEDMDLCWRARLGGWRVVLAPESRIDHFYSFNRNKNKFYYLERNRLVASLKNYSGRSLLVLAPAFLGAEMAMLGYSLAGGWFPEKLKGYMFLLQNYTAIGEKRRAVQGKRRVPDAALASFWTDRMGFADLKESPLTKVANPVSRAYWKLAKKFI